MGTCFFILAVFSYYSYNALKEYKELKLEEITKEIKTEVDYVNKNIAATELTVKNIASNAGIIYNEKHYLPEEKVRQYLSYLLLHSQEVYDLGGGFGVWFEPYAFDESEKDFALLVYKDLIQNKTITKWHGDLTLENYNQADWYKQLLPSQEVKEDIYNRKKVFWSMPVEVTLGSETRLITNIGAYIYGSNNKMIGLATIGWQMSDFVRTLEHINISPNSKLLLADIKYNKVITYTLNKSIKTGDSPELIPWFAEISSQLPHLGKVNIHEVKITGEKHYIFTALTDNNMLLASIVPEQDLFSSIEQKSRNTVILLVVFSITMILFTTYLVNRMLSQPIKKISSTVEHLHKSFDPEFTFEQMQAPAEIHELTASLSKIIRHNNTTLKSILDGINNMIYIVDTRTFKLNYVNKHMSKIFAKIEKDAICYEKFLGKSEPCPFCPVISIQQNFPESSWQNHTDGYFEKRIYSLQASLVEWNGSENHALISVADITKEVAEKERLEVLAETDELTGALNRRGGILALERISLLEHGVEIAIVIVDLNGLKAVNDNYGHIEGDSYIVTLVEAIKKNIRTNDLLSRLGGDEFLIILPNCNNEVADRIMRRVSYDLSTMLEQTEKPYSGSFSYGIQTFLADQDLDSTSIIEKADQKMYTSKKDYYKNKN